jgi:hypothetical protein
MKRLVLLLLLSGTALLPNLAISQMLRLENKDNELAG